VGLLLAAIEARGRNDKLQAIELYEKALKLAESKWGQQDQIVESIKKELETVAEPPKNYDQN